MLLPCLTFWIFFFYNSSASLHGTLASNSEFRWHVGRLVINTCLCIPLRQLESLICVYDVKSLVAKAQGKVGDTLARCTSCIHLWAATSAMIDNPLFPCCVCVCVCALRARACVCFPCYVWFLVLTFKKTSMTLQTLHFFSFCVCFQGCLLCGSKMCKEILRTGICCENHQHEKAISKR